MPLNRYLIRNEYNLADREVYQSARKDDPEALLEGVTMAGLVGVLRQLGDLAEFAAEIFHGLHEEVMATAARSHDLIVRVQQLEAEIPSVEKTLLSQTSPTAAFCNTGVDWHSKVHIDENVVTQRDLPRFVMDSYEDCRGPPQLFLLDKFDVAGAGACLKRYSDPSFLKIESADPSYTNSEAQRDKKTRKTKRRVPRMRNANTSEVSSSSHANLHQLLSQDTESGNTDPERRVKLKKRPLDGFHCPEKSGKSYMQKLIDVCSPEHKFVHEISLDIVLMDPVPNITPKSGLEIVETDTAIPSQETFEGNKETLSPSYVPELVDKRSINELIEVTNGKHAELSWENQGSDSDKILLLLSKEMNDEEELAADSRRKSEDEKEESHSDDMSDNDSLRKSEDEIGESHSDDMSDNDSFEDALATMESEVETDSESRTKRDLHHLNSGKTTVDSDGSDGQDFNDPFSDFQSFVNSTTSTSDDGSVLNKEREHFSHSESKSNVAESVPDGGEEAAEKSSEDLLHEQHSLSVVVGRKKTDDYVACNTLEILDRRSRVKSKLEEAYSKSSNIGDTYAKTEIKWVQRCDEVSSDETVSSSLSSAEDPHIADPHSSPSQKDCTLDDSVSYLFDQINEPSGTSVMLSKEASSGCASVAEKTPFSSHIQEKSTYMDSKDDNHVLYPEEKAPEASLQADLGKELGDSKDKISGTRDDGLLDQFDVSKERLLCCGDVANISLLSKAEDGQKMVEELVSTHSDQTLKSGTCPVTSGQDIEEYTCFVDQNETQAPILENIYLLEPICSGETKTAEKHKFDPTEARVTGSDEHISITNGIAQSGLVVKESPNAIYVVDALFGLSDESTENQTDSPASYLHQSDSSLCKRSDDKQPDDCVKTIERDVYLDSENDRTKEEKFNRTCDSPSEHFIGSYVFEEEKYLDMNDTADHEVFGEIEVTGDQNDSMKDENADVGPFSLPLHHPPPLDPMEQHENFYVTGSQNGQGNSLLSPECPTKFEAYMDRSHVDDVPVNSGSILCGTMSTGDPESRPASNGTYVFMADDDQDNHLADDEEDHTDASDNYDCTKSLVAVGGAEEPCVDKCSLEGSRSLDLDQPVPANFSAQSTNLATGSKPLEARTVVPSTSYPSQDQPLVAEFLVEMASYTTEIQKGMEPSTLLPDQIKVSENQTDSPASYLHQSDSPLRGTMSTDDLESRPASNAPCVFMADDDQDNHHADDEEDDTDASDNYDCTKSLVAVGGAEEPRVDQCSLEGSRSLDLDQPVPANFSAQSTNLATGSKPLEARTVLPSTYPSQDQPLVAEFLVEMASYTTEIQKGMEPSTSSCPSRSLLPDQIKVSEKFVSRQSTDTSTGSPVLGVMSDTSQTKLDEAPPLPPLPPMQWRLGKNQPSSPSMSVQQIATHQSDNYNLMGPQPSNPFSFSHEDSKFMDLSTQEKMIDQEAAVQDVEVQHISAGGQQEKAIPDEPLDHISSLTEQEIVSFSSQPASPLSVHGVQLQHGFIFPEDQEAWSRNAFFAVEPGSGNAKMQKPPRPRNPLIEEVVALDKSKLRKVGERVRPQDGLRAEDIKQSLPKLRKVGERPKPKDGPISEKLEQRLPHLRKVEVRVKSADKEKLEEQEQSIALSQEVAERIELHDEPKSEEKGDSLPGTSGGRAGLQDELKSVGGQSIPRLQKIGARADLQGGRSTDDRDLLMEQIKNKTFNLKPTVTTRASIQGPQTNLNIAAILEKATTIRQAMAGSDEDDSDGWSDN